MEYVAWTAERKEILKTMWANGASSTEIANSLQGTTRNAVIGVVHRMGLSGRSKQNTNRKKAKSSAYGAISLEQRRLGVLRSCLARGANRGASASLKSARENKFKQPTKLQQPFKAEPFKPAAEITIPPGQAKTLLELEAYHCRFPLWQTADDPKHYCGGKKCAGTPYCVDHARICFTPVPQRRAIAAHAVPVKNNEAEFV